VRTFTWTLVNSLWFEPSLVMSLPVLWLSTNPLAFHHYPWFAGPCPRTAPATRRWKIQIKPAPETGR